MGAFLVLPLIEGYRRTGKESYKEAAVKGLRHYLKELKEYGYTTAGALDIFSIDKESGIPLLKGAMALYELTGEKEWLDGALDSAWYLSTWQYTHTCHFGPESVLGQTGYDSFGGTLVSTVHDGIDPFAAVLYPGGCISSLGYRTGTVAEARQGCLEKRLSAYFRRQPGH